jgi:hypothetical protein
VTRNHVLRIINSIFPVIGISLMFFYQVCDIFCSTLQGWFMGLDLKVIGVLYMAALLPLALPAASRWADSLQLLRITLLSCALGGKTLLLRFSGISQHLLPFLSGLRCVHSYPVCR